MSNKPANTIRDGKLSVTIWRNPRSDGEGVFYEVVPGRTYTDENEKAQTAHGFSGNDILAMSELLTQAWNWIRVQRQKDKAEASQQMAA